MTLTGIGPVPYNTELITVDRSETASDTYDIEWMHRLGSDRRPWHGKNYYITSKRHPFLHADIHEYDATGAKNGGDDNLRNCFSYYPNNRELQQCFIWPMGKEFQARAGVQRWDHEHGVHPEWKVDAAARIKVNQKANALCLTHLVFEQLPFPQWGEGWSMRCWFTIYDKYGNTGTFSATYDTKQELIKIENHNP